MIENSYLAILSHDSIVINHPIRKQPVKLYRVISTKSFKLPKFNIYIEKYDIGGYVQSIDNLDENNPVWIANTARVFDSAKILNGSYIHKNALVFGNAIVENSQVSGFARAHGYAQVYNSELFDQSEIKENAQVLESIFKNATQAFGKCIIHNSILSKGAFVHGNAEVYDSDLTDISEIRNNATIRNCKYSGRIIRTEGEYINETIDKQPNLKVYEELDPNTHAEYKLPPK